MKSIWQINIEALESFYALVNELEKYYDRPLTAEEKEITFLELMKTKGLKPIGHTELNKNELIKEQVSHGKSILNIDDKGYTFIKPKENEK